MSPTDKYAFRSDPKMLLKRVPGKTPVTVYHGTEEKHREGIAREGLVADGYVSPEKRQSRQGLHVTVDERHAHAYAGKEGKVLRTTIPRGQLKVNRAYLNPEAWTGPPIAAEVRGGKVSADRIEIYDKGEYKPLVKK